MTQPQQSLTEAQRKQLTDMLTRNTRVSDYGCGYRPEKEEEEQSWIVADDETMVFNQAWDDDKELTLILTSKDADWMANARSELMDAVNYL